MEQKSHIITEQVFGSSRKIQFIGLSTPVNNTETTRPSSMDSLLSAIDHHQHHYNRHHHQQQQQQQQQQHYRTINQRQQQYRPDIFKTSSSSSTNTTNTTHQSMSIESLLDNNHFQHHRQSQSASTHEVSIASLLTSDNTSNHKRRWDYQQSQAAKKSSKKPKDNNTNEKHKTIITCLHASVAQKSYGSEKRFLCPPPIVQIKSPSNSTMTNEQRAEKMQLSMSVLCENGDKILEQRSVLDENQSGSFKYLHVTGTAKAKQFNLKVDLLPNTTATTTTTASSSSDTPPPQDPQPLASFISKPISIISKPSKKTAKTRNVSTCILANSPVSLFNRINSQTVRTKYMTSSNNMLCAKNTTWSPFDIIIVNQPKLPQPHKLPTRQQMTTTVSGRYTSRIQLAHPPPPPPPQTTANNGQQNHNKMPIHVTYGTEIVLRDSQTGVTSPSLIIRKVDKGRIAQCAYGPVSQMQKIALQLASTINSQPIYLSAAGSMNDNSVNASPSSSSSSSSSGADSSNTNNGSCTWLDYSPSRLVQPEKTTLELSYEEVDDYLCWTIVGINKFEYDYHENESFQGNQQDITDVAEFKPAEVSTTAPSATTIATTPPPSPPRHITPFPILTTIEYKHEDHTLNVVGQHLIQAAPVPRLLDLWLGTHGPLVTRISQPPQPHTPHETHWSVQLPPTQDLLLANHDLLVTHADGRRNLELALLLVRQDGLVYHTSKALSCDVLDDTGRWNVVSASSSSTTNTSS